MSEWQPIETAPKDGTKIFIFRDGWDASPIAFWGEIFGEDGPFHAWIFTDSSLCLGVDEGVLGWNEDIADGAMPTYWWPTPEPPK